MGHLGAILGLSWGYLGLRWEHHGLSWVDLGAILALPGATLPVLCCPPISIKIFETCVSSARNACFRNPPPRLFPELLVEHPWGHLGLSCSHLGAILGYIGPILGPSRAFLGLSWLSFCGKLCVTQNLLGQISCNAKFANANLHKLGQDCPRKAQDGPKMGPI